MRTGVLFLFIHLFIIGSAQEKEVGHTKYARKVIKKLSSEKLYGRGYVKNGHLLAAQFLENEFRNIGLKKFGNSHEQFFTIPAVNTFPDHAALYFGKQKLEVGTHFIVHATCPTYNQSHDAVRIKKIPKKPSKKYKDKFVIVDEALIKNSDNPKEVHKRVLENVFGASGVIISREKLTHSYASKQAQAPVVEVLSSKIPLIAGDVHLIIDAELKENVKAENIIGYIPGSEKPDSFIVFSAHYDHLGMMGLETYFPGANDNASGVSMILTLARYFMEHKPRYSIAFIAFGGEETGLLGSKYYTEHPLFSLSKIRFLINLDILGTGDDGIQIVNGSVYQQEFDAISDINTRNKNLLKQVKTRGEAANSDHYPFHKKGVPSFFIYTLGGIKAYHDVFDKEETLPLTEYEDLFKLLVIFSNELDGSN